MIWHPNGQLRSEENWKEGERNGLSKYWYNNGKRSSQSTHNNGVLIEEKNWYENHPNPVILP